MYSVVQVQFNHGAKHYPYFTDLKLEVGDQCLVCVSGQFSMVTVSKVEGLSSDAKGRSHQLIVQKVDKVAWKENCKKLEKVNRIKEELWKAKKEFEDAEVFKIMAFSNPHVRDLLLQLRDLGESHP